MAKVYRLLVGNGNAVEVELLDLDGAAVEGASLSVTVLDLAGEPIGGATWPIALAGLAAAGHYRALLPATLALVQGERYRVVVSGTAGGVAYRTEPLVKAVEQQS